MTGGVGELVEERRVVAVRIREGGARRHVHLVVLGDVVGARGVPVERRWVPVARDHRLRAFQRIRAAAVHPCGQRHALALVDVEDGVEADEREALDALGILPIPPLDPLPEHDPGAVLAAADVPARGFGLAVGEPARVAPAPLERGHLEDERVDAAVGAVGAGVAMPACAPRRAPRHGAALKRGDDAAGDLLVGVGPAARLSTPHRGRPREGAARDARRA